MADIDTEVSAPITKLITEPVITTVKIKPKRKSVKTRAVVAVQKQEISEKQTVAAPVSLIVALLAAAALGYASGYTTRSVNDEYQAVLFQVQNPSFNSWSQADTADMPTDATSTINQDNSVFALSSETTCVNSSSIENQTGVTRNETASAIVCMFAIPLNVGTVQKFKDVNQESPFYGVVQTLSNTDISGGCGDGNYCGEMYVTRAQLATLLVKTAKLTIHKYAGQFSDINATNLYRDYIQTAIDAGIMSPSVQDNKLFEPNGYVLSSDLKVFLTRAQTLSSDK